MRGYTCSDAAPPSGLQLYCDLCVYLGINTYIEDGLPGNFCNSGMRQTDIEGAWDEDSIILSRL